MNSTIDIPRTRLTASQLDRLRKSLEDDRATVMESIESHEGSLSAFLAARRDVATDDENDPEGPSMAVQRSEASAMLAQSQRHLDEVDVALAKLDEGTFGVCARCGRDIPLARLNARPHAAHCVSCAEQIGL